MQGYRGAEGRAKQRRGRPGLAGAAEKTYVVLGGLLVEMYLDAVGHEAENGTNPQKDREATEQLFTEFDPF